MTSETEESLSLEQVLLVEHHWWQMIKYSPPTVGNNMVIGTDSLPYLWSILLPPQSSCALVGCNIML